MPFAPFALQFIATLPTTAKPAPTLASRYLIHHQTEPTMNPLSIVTNLTAAITYPFRMIFVVGLCAFINYFTSPGVWWVHWVAFGMGIGLIVVWARAIKTLVLTVGVAAIGYFVYRWWQNRQQPDAVVRTLAEVKTFNPNQSRAA
jgi:hypothetical protein